MSDEGLEAARKMAGRMEDPSVGAMLRSLAAEVERLRSSELAWKIIAKQNNKWNDLPQSEKEAALHKALDTTMAENIQMRDALELAADYIKDCDGGDMTTETGWKRDDLLDAWLKVRAAAGYQQSTAEK